MLANRGKGKALASPTYKGTWTENKRWKRLKNGEPTTTKTTTTTNKNKFEHFCTKWETVENTTNNMLKGWGNNSCVQFLVSAHHQQHTVARKKNTANNNKFNLKLHERSMGFTYKQIWNAKDKEIDVQFGYLLFESEWKCKSADTSSSYFSWFTEMWMRMEIRYFCSFLLFCIFFFRSHSIYVFFSRFSQRIKVSVRWFFSLLCCFVLIQFYKRVTKASMFIF